MQSLHDAYLVEHQQQVTCMDCQYSTLFVLYCDLFDVAVSGFVTVVIVVFAVCAF